MIIYNESSSKFINHLLEQRIESVLLEKVQEKVNHSVSPSEIRSWTNSLPQMAKILSIRVLENVLRKRYEENRTSTFSSR